MSNTFFQVERKTFQRGFVPLRPHSYGPECTHSDRKIHLGWEPLRYRVAHIQVNSNKMCNLFDIHIVILLNIFIQKVLTRLTEHDGVISPLLRGAPRLGLALGPALARAGPDCRCKREMHGTPLSSRNFY